MGAGGVRWVEDAVARARREAFPKPIVALMMNERQWAAAIDVATELELKDLNAGRASGQIVVSDEVAS